MSEQIVKQAAELHAQDSYQEAINLIESNFNNFDQNTKIPALLQGFYAAQKLNDINKAKFFAKAIASEDPNIPSIQPYLD